MLSREFLEKKNSPAQHFWYSARCQRYRESDAAPKPFSPYLHLNWSSVANHFEAAVDSNTQLTNSEKLNYLKACVKGEAPRLITIQIDNKNATVQAHLHFQKTSEFAKRLRKLLETTTEHMRAVTELKQPTSQ